jgi:hypothetical protein
MVKMGINTSFFSYRVHALPAKLVEPKAESGANIGFTLDIAHAVSTPLNPVEYALSSKAYLEKLIKEIEIQNI